MAHKKKIITKGNCANKTLKTKNKFREKKSFLKGSQIQKNKNAPHTKICNKNLIIAKILFKGIPYVAKEWEDDKKAQQMYKKIKWHKREAKATM